MTVQATPELQRFLAERMHAATVEIDSGHLSLITHAGEVTELTMNAVQAVRRSAAADATPQPIEEIPKDTVYRVRRAQGR